jgi:hypothetical protein
MTNVPSPRGALYRASELIYQEGSKTESQLFSAIDFGHKPSVRAKALAEAIGDGWLIRLGDGRIALSTFAVDHFDEIPREPPPKFVGQVAAPRHVDLMNRKPYSPPKRMVRGDVPAWSLRTQG